MNWVLEINYERKGNGGVTTFSNSSMKFSFCYLFREENADPIGFQLFLLGNEYMSFLFICRRDFTLDKLKNRELGINNKMWLS